MCCKSILSRLAGGCVLTVLLIAGEARADVELDFQNNSKTINPAKTLTWTHQCSGDNRILLVGAANRNNNSVDAIAVTYNGVNLTKLASHDNGSLHHSVWALLNPPTNGNFNVTVFLDNSNPSHTREIAAGSLSVKNAQQLLPTIGNGRVFTATGSSTSPAINVSGMIVGGLAFNSIGAIVDPVVASANAPQLEQWNIQTSGSPAANQILNGGGTRQNVSGVVPMNWTLAASKSWASIGVRVAAVPPTMASAANQVFVVGDSPTTAADITIQDNGAVIDATTDIRIRIPAGFNMTWDTSVLSFAAGGTASLKVNASNVGYEDGGKTAVIDVISDMSVQDSLIISGLKFANFTAGGTPVDNLEMEVKNDGTVSATDSATIEIRAASIAYSDATTSFTAGSAASPGVGVNAIVVTDDASAGLINTTDDIRIRIPDTLDMTWDTASNMPTLNIVGTGAVGATVTFENNDKTAVIDVTSNFGAGDELTIIGLRFANFNARSGPDVLALDIRNNGGTSDSTVASLSVRGPLMSSSADQEFALMNPSDVAHATITISEDTVGTITAANDIRVRIPNGFDMFWDNTVTAPAAFTVTVAGGTGTINFVFVSYSGDDKSLIIYVLTDFTGNEVVTISTTSGFEFTSFLNQTGLDNLELVIDGSDNGLVAAFDSQTIVIAGAQIESVGAGQSFNTGGPSTLADNVRITENVNASTISDANDIRIRIPTGVDLLWDQTVTMAGSMFGTAVGNGRVNAAQTLTYEDAGRTLFIEVINGQSFAPGEILEITGLSYTSFGATSQDFLELDTLNDPTKVGATDPQFLRVVAPTLSSLADQTFPVGASSAPASLITITEDTRVQTITMANDIRIRIPGAVDMVWDSAVNTPTMMVTGSGTVDATVTFENGDKTAVISVTSGGGFGLGDVLTVNGLQFKTFASSTAIPDNLELVVTGNFADPANATDDKTKAITGVNDPPSFSTTGNVNVLGSTGANSIPGWLNGIGPGAGETGQTVSFMVSNDNNALFTTQPNIIAGGPIGPGSYPDQNLTFTLAPGAFGVANITITAMDNGGTANGGNDTSAPRTLKITVFEAVTTIHNKSQGAVTTATVNSYAHTVPAGENRAIYVGVGWHDTAGEVVTSVTYNGLPLSLQGAGVQVNDGSETMSNRMYARALGTGPMIVANVVVTVNNNTFISSGAVSMCGVNQAAVITGVGGVTGDSKTPIAVFTGVTPDQVIVDSVAVTRSPFPTPPDSIAPTVAAQTEQWDVTSTASGSFQDHVLAAGSTRSNGNGSVTNRWLLNTTTSRIWSIIAGKVGGSGFISLSSAANQSLEIGQTGVAASIITITETTGTPQITAANDIRIRIPAGLDITWDTSVLLGALTFGGTYVGSVTAISFSGDMKTVILDIDTNFTDGQTFTVDGLVIDGGSMASAADNLELVTSGNNADPAITEDDKTKNIIQPLTISSAADQSFVVNDASTAIEVITITEHETTPEMLIGNTLCIDIPVGVDMTWNTASSPTFGGSGFMNVTGPAVFSNGDRRMCVNITTSFSPGQTLTISGLDFAN